MLQRVVKHACAPKRAKFIVQRPKILVKLAERLVLTIPAYPEFALLHLEEEQFYVFYRKGLHLWENEPYIGIEKLQGLPLCSNTLQFHLLKRICDEDFIKLNVSFMANTLNNAYTLIQNTDNVAVLAAMAGDKIPEGLTRKLIKDARLVFHQVFYWNKARPMSLPAQAFWSFSSNSRKKYENKKFFE